MKIDKYDWDLESLLHNQTLESLYKTWFNLCTKQVSLVNDFYKTKDNFINWLKLDLESTKVSNRLMNYISNHSAENLSEQKWIGWMQKISFDANEFNKKLYVYSNLILKNEKKIRSYLQDPKLKSWVREFELHFKTKPHILDDKSEKIMANLSADSGSVGDVFTTLLDSDVKYEPAKDSKGKSHPILTSADFVKLLKNHDRILRKNAWLNFYKTLHNFRNTFAKTLYYNYLRANTWAKTRNYKDYVDSTLFNDEVDEKLLLSIYDNVQTYKDLFVQFRKIRGNCLKSMFKINKLEPWDLSLDLTKSNVKFNIEQAKKEVISALKPLGKEYIQVVNKAFNENWISWLPKQHKTSGAYSIGGTFGLDKYYILTNFNNSSDDVSTIAHEMGHSMNSYYINKHQTIYADVDMFVAEIASIVNEMLLNFYWINKYKNNKVMLLHIYDNMLSTFFACTSRQITFSKFEWLTNQLINQGQPFTPDVAAKIYLECRKQYEGVTKEAENKLKKEPYCFASTGILRVPHFYANSFYVYKYAIGQIIALVVATKIASGDKQMLNNYIKFLSVGCSLPPLDIIRILKIDLYKNDVYLEAKNIINKFINNFNKLK